jgi:hypothetical protein
MEEMHTLLHVLDQQKFAIERCGEFLDRFGNMADASQVSVCVLPVVQPVRREIITTTLLGTEIC